MSISELAAVVEGFGSETVDLPFYLLDSEAFDWREYAGVRMAHLHTTMELHALAGEILAARAANGADLKRGQYLLMDHHRAFRTIEAMLLGLPETFAETIPSPEEWSLKKIVLHIHSTERYFYASICNALAGRPLEDPTSEEIAEWSEEPEILPTSLTLAQSFAAYKRLHDRIRNRLKGLTDEDLATPSAIWESEPRPIAFRLSRFAAHLREHTESSDKDAELAELAAQRGQDADAADV